MATTGEVEVDLGDLRNLTDVAPERDVWCVYFLMWRGEVLYIGATCDARVRVASHRVDPCKRFNRVMFLPVPDQTSLYYAEKYWIAALCPRHNAADNPHYNPDKWPPWGGNSADRIVRLELRKRREARRRGYD